MLLIDIAFAVIFLGGVFGLWYRVTQKIPELVAIPDQVIVERLHEDSAKVRLFILHIKIFYQEAKYKEAFWKIAGKVLYKFHIAVLRIDNSIVRVLKKIKTAGVFNGNGSGNGNGEYWKQLQEGLSNPAVNPVRTGSSQPAAENVTPPSAISVCTVDRSRQRSNGVKNTRIQEVRSKKI